MKPGTRRRRRNRGRGYPEAERVHAWLGRVSLIELGRRRALLGYWSAKFSPERRGDPLAAPKPKPPLGPGAGLGPVPREARAGGLPPGRGT